MDEFVRVFSLEEVAPGTARVTTVGDYDVGVFNVDGALHGGKVNKTTCRVSCPLHGREFSLIDGTEEYGRQPVATFDVEVRDGAIFVAAAPRPLVLKKA